MQVDFFGNNIRAETDGLLVSLTDLVKAGNAWRAGKGMTLKPLQAIVESVGFKEFVEVVKRDTTVDSEKILLTTGKGNTKRTMAHLTVAVYVAEQMSPEFHYQAIKTFLEGKLLEFRELGGTEFKNLNAAIDLYLPGRSGKDNRGVYIQIAKAVRTKLMGEGAEAGCWDSATVAQIHTRYATEANLITMLRIGVVRDYEHLKEIVDKL